MDRERWQRIEALYNSALDVAAGERADFLHRACGDDDPLRREIVSLLAAHDQAGSFIAGNAVEDQADRIAAAPFAEQPTAHFPTQIGRSINQYKIISAIGKGGMGEVWLAEDTRLHRKVALKLLPAQFTQDADRVRRFEQEAQAVSALNHPNIITLFDLGHVGADYFMATEFIDGQTLRERLRENARVPVAEAIGIALQICHALAAVHTAGIIHRDINPENVMLRRDGYVKVLDFGLAKVIEKDPLRPNTGQASLTDPGAVMGTVSYMSPEQARGQRVDARSDIFSFGIVLYEMLAGRQPFEGESVSDVLAAILKTEPLPIGFAPADVPDALQRVVMRALSKDRDTRHQKIEDLAEELRQFAEEHRFKARLARSGGTAADAATSRRTFPRKHAAAGLALLLALLTGLLFWQLKRAQPSAPAASAPIKTLAVLPFRFLGSVREEEYLGLGITDALITKLSSARNLTVRPTTAVLKYQSVAIEPDTAARELKTDAVLDGSVQKVGDKLRVTAQLIRAGEAQPLWAGDFSESINDLFTLQDKLAARVTEELALQLTGSEQQQVARRTTANSAAYRLYLQGRYFHNKRTNEGVRQAREFYERAIALDPGFAEAHAELALSWSVLTERGIVPQTEGARQAVAFASKAIELDDTLADAHAYLAYMRLIYYWDLPGAEAEWRRALELGARHAMTRQFHGVHLLACGRADEAIAETLRAVELDPTSLIARSQLARAFFLGRRYDEVIATCQELLRIDENYAQAYVWLGQAHTQQGKHALAITALEKANTLAVARSEILASLGYAYAIAGRIEDARRIIDDLQTRSVGLGRLYHLATVYAGLNERSAALAQLEEAYQRRDPGLILRGKLDPKLDTLRGEPRFIALLQHLGL